MLEIDRRTGTERRSNWRDATETLVRDLIDDLIVLERQLRAKADVAGQHELGIVAARAYDDAANDVASVIRRHQTP